MSASPRAALRNSAARLLFACGITAPGRRSAGRLSIATFHRVLPEPERQAYPYPGLAVTPQELDQLLAYFARHFDCGPLAVQHQRYLSEERNSRPLLALTFDDAQHDNYRNARPVLSLHGLKASFFVPVTAVERHEMLWHDRLGFSIFRLMEQGAGGRERLAGLLAAAGISAQGAGNPAQNAVKHSKKLSLEARLHLVDAVEGASGRKPAPEFARMMTFGELAELAAEGHEIGSHSMTHCLMPECDDAALRREVGESRRVLQERVGQPVDTFCYPNGDSDERSSRAVAEAGYRRAVTTSWGDNDRQSDRFRLRRFDMDAARMRAADGNVAPAVVALRMSGFYPGLG